MSDELTQVEIAVTVDLADEQVVGILREGGSLACNVDASDIVSGLNNNDGLLLAFIKEVVEAAGSSELSNDLVEWLTGEDGDDQDGL